MSQQVAFSEKRTGYVIIFAVVGVCSVVAGIADFMVTLSGNPLDFGIVSVPGGGFRGIWGGLVMIFAGVMCLSGLAESNEIHRFARVVMGCILLWIMAGTDLFALVLEAIPGDDTWIVSWNGFLEKISPPYTPAVLITPLSLLIIRYIRMYKREIGSLD